MRAKSKVHIFLSCVAACLCAIPVAERFAASKEQRPPWISREMFNFDRFFSWVSRPLAAYGVSVSPGDAVIGYGGWDFLGDTHQDSISSHRRSATPADEERNSRIISAGIAWDLWLREKGVRVFRIMVVPDKQSVYGEYAPKWAKTSPDAPIERLKSLPEKGVHVFLAPALLSAARSRTERLYYMHDSHWNELGAWLGYRAFAESVREHAPEVAWLPAEFFTVDGTTERQGGDMSLLLRLQAWDREEVPVLKPAPADELSTVGRAEELPDILEQGEPARLLRRHNPGALNAAKVLWLTDSFGDSLKPFMERTFADLAILHWDKALASPRNLVGLVERERPQFVFVTVIERMARRTAFVRVPPDGKKAEVAADEALTY